jgi:N-acetylneuraminate synthase
LVCLSSPFSVKAVEMLDEIGVPAWKVGSGEISTPDLLDAIIDTKKPVLLSTGMSSYGEIDKITKKLNQRGVQFALFQCTSCYPVSLEDIGLNVLDEFRKRYKCPVGLSDHSGSVYPCLTAMARNADLVEVHVVIDRRLFGPDVVASIAIDELAMLVRTREAIHVMDQNPVDKDAFAAGMIDTKSLSSKSVASTRKLLKGTVLERDMLMLKKPGNGILPNEKESIIGRRLRRNVSPERILQWEDIEL